MRSLNSINTEAAIGAVAAPLTGLPACIAGSSVAALVYDKPLGDDQQAVVSSLAGTGVSGVQSGIVGQFKS